MIPSFRDTTYSLIFNDIIYITSHSKNVIIHTEERDIELPVLMKDIMIRLPQDMFVRIHKRHIINLKYIHSLSHVLSGHYKVRLKDSDETELPVGRAFAGSLRKKI
jgi:DNA-binding LytR/AlgR family response regulator